MAKATWVVDGDKIVVGIMDDDRKNLRLTTAEQGTPEAELPIKDLLSKFLKPKP